MIKKKIVLLLVFAVISSAAGASVVTTKHNLSSNGPGAYKSLSEKEICVFCHIPHGGNPAKPLWNHSATVATFTPYDQAVSSTLKSNPGQPDGSSKLCLSCHDGTVAIGSTVSMGTVSGLAGKLSGSSLIGTNLSNSHPVSFVYDNILVLQRGELADPASLTGAVKLDKNSKLQCTSCHNPHDNTNGNFLVVENKAGVLCVSCHSKTGWGSSIHKTSPAIAGEECKSCHKSHGAGAVPLIKKEQVSLCYGCHSAVEPAFSGTSRFSGAGSAGSYTTVNSQHDLSGGDRSYSGSSLTCANCHNAHVTTGNSGVGGGIETLIDPNNRKSAWTGNGATDYRESINNFCLSCHSGTFPSSVSNPNQSVAPAGSMINIASAYQTDVHGYGSVRPTANNSAQPVTAMICTVCHNPHGSHYTDQAWDGNIYHFNNVIDGTEYDDNGAESALPYNWPYVAPSSPKGVVKDIRVSPNTVNTAGDDNNLNNLCSACHSKTSGPSGAAHTQSLGSCTNCHHHGNPIQAGGL